MAVAAVTMLVLGCAIAFGPACRLGRPFVPKWFVYGMAASCLLGMAAGLVKVVAG